MSGTPNQQNANRRENREDRHRLSVGPDSGEKFCRLKVTCTCGERILLRRAEDLLALTLSDLLELFRIHIMAVDWNKDRRKL